jgi:hypothetical protein
MVEGSKEKVDMVGKKKGRRLKDGKNGYVVNKEQTKFFVDLSKDELELGKVQEILMEANTKSHGGEILFKDLALYAVSKLGQKDIEKLQENSLSEMEKVERSLDEYNVKNGTKLKLGEYLLKRLNLN